MHTKRRLLFVDDEQSVSTGLHQQVGRISNDWDVEFVSSAKDALDLLEKKKFDVLITDMRMSGTDGPELLKETNRRFPQIMRLVLSSFADQEAILRCIGVTHQFLSKPCDVGLLRSRITSALALRDLLEDETLKTLLAQVSSIPSLPAEYRQIMQELQSDEPSLDKVGKIIAKDIGMTAKVLQMINSAFFGLRGRVSSPEQAVRLLGLDTISSLVLVISVFSQVRVDKIRGLELENLWQHSQAVGLLAREIARNECKDRVMIEDAYTAGLLHGIGMLIMAERRKDYADVVSAAENQQIPLWEAEKAMLDVTSNQVGAYLLALWGLPHAVVEAVAWQKQPSLCPNPEFSPLSTVHIADSLLNCPSHAPLDTKYLEQMWDSELSSKIESWNELRRNMPQ